MDICSFRNFIEEHDLNCLELQWVDNRRCEFIFMTNEENHLFKVVYDEDKNGTLGFSKAHITPGVIDFFMDTSTMESMLLYQQYKGIHHYRGNNVVPIAYREV